jgi:hypothetical protein
MWATPTNALCYRKFLIAERLAVWRLEHNGESLKMRQHKEKATLVQLLICRFTRAISHTLKLLRSLEYLFSTLLKCNFLALCHSLVLTLFYLKILISQKFGCFMM